MKKNRILSAFLTFMMVCSLLPSSASAAFDERTHRTVYLHAQGENPDGTNSSTVYMVDTAGICFDPEYLDSPNPAKLNRMKEYLTKLDDEQLEKLSKNISALPTPLKKANFLPALSTGPFFTRSKNDKYRVFPRLFSAPSEINFPTA